METNKPIKSCMLLICGLPSSGKSLLTNNLLKHSKTNPRICIHNNKSDDEFVFYNISIDQLISINEQSINIQINGFWKQFRSDLLIASKMFINRLLNQTDPNCSNNNQVNQNVLSIYQSINKLNNYCPKTRHNFVLIVDDNFYYRSMRYEWFQVSKQYRMGFALIMINCSLDLAIERNQGRSDDKCVPNSVIIKMNDRFEHSQMNGFEMRTFNVSADAFDFVITDDLIQFIIDAIRNPVVELNFINEEMREESKLVTQSNVIHRVDCILRQVINERIANSVNKREIAKALNEAKKSVLNDLKQSVDILPPGLRNQILTNQPISDIKLFLNDLLNKNVTVSQK